MCRMGYLFLSGIVLTIFGLISPGLDPQVVAGEVLVMLGFCELASRTLD